MGIESFLGNGDRANALNELKLMLAKDIYINCILCNVDPESFNHIDYVNSINDTNTPRLGSNWNTLFDLCQKMLVVENKIASL